MPASRGCLCALVLGLIVAASGCGRIGFEGLDNPADGDADLDGTFVVSIGDAPGTDVSSVTFDTSLIDDEFNHNCGSCNNIYAGSSEVGLLRFDLSDIGSAPVVSASLGLWLYNDPTTMGTIKFYAILEEWDEGENMDQRPGVANWVERKPGVRWTAEGVGAGSRSADPFVELIPNPRPEMTEIALPVEMVQGWLDDPGSNFGVMFKGNGWNNMSGEDHPHFVSSEGGPEDRRPLLMLTVR